VDANLTNEHVHVNGLAKPPTGSAPKTNKATAAPKPAPDFATPKPTYSRSQLIGKLEDEENCLEEVAQAIAGSYARCRSACLDTAIQVREINWCRESDLFETAAEEQKPILDEAHEFWGRFYRSAEYFRRMPSRILGYMIETDGINCPATSAAQIGAAFGKLIELSEALLFQKTKISPDRSEYFAEASLALLPEPVEIDRILGAIMLASSLIHSELCGNRQLSSKG
jgi:hypothetical protein